MSTGNSLKISKIVEVLEKEREDLIQGNLHKLAVWAKAKEEFANLPEQVWRQLTEEDANRIAELLERNAQLLEACEKGIRTVRNRIVAFEDIKAGKQTYGPDGRSETLNTINSTRSKAV